MPSVVSASEDAALDTAKSSSQRKMNGNQIDSAKHQLATGQLRENNEGNKQLYSHGGLVAIQVDLCHAVIT